MALELNEGEKICFDCQPGRRAVMYWFFSNVIYLWLAVIGLAILLGFSHIYLHLGQFQHGNLLKALKQANYIPYVLVVIGLLIIIGGATYMWCNKMAQNYHYVVTNQRCVLHYGMLSLSRSMIPIHNIMDIDMQATFFERLFGMGSVYVDNIGTFTGQMMGGIGAISVTSRLEGLTLEECEQVMNLLSKMIAEKKS